MPLLNLLVDDLRIFRHFAALVEARRSLLLNETELFARRIRVVRSISHGEVHLGSALLEVDHGLLALLVELVAELLSAFQVQVRNILDGILVFLEELGLCVVHAVSLCSGLLSQLLDGDRLVTGGCRAYLLRNLA